MTKKSVFSVLTVAAVLGVLATFALVPALRARADADAGRVIIVRMLDDGGSFRYEPAKVRVRRGDIVRFEQAGAMPHNVEFVRNTVPAGVDLAGAWMSSFLVARGETYDVVIDERFADGAYDYVCSPHAPMGMAGVIEVSGEASRPAAPATAVSTPVAALSGDLPVVTGTHGAQPLDYEREGDVKVFRMTVEQIRWETKEGKLVEAWAFNRQVPGPTIRVAEGERVRIIVTNALPEGTTTHWHGLEVPNNMDGVPGISQDPIEPGESFSYEFVAKPSGTHLYHSHFNALHQEEHGLYGMFIVDPPSEGPQFRADREEIMILGDGPLGFVINGKEFPAITPIDVKKGERVRVRMANLGGLYHPMHMHGGHFQVVAKDGFPLPAPQDMNTLSLAPGETFDVVMEAREPGTWLWHCHVLSHVTGPKGPDGVPTAAGMIGVIQVQGDDVASVDHSKHTTH